MAVLSMMSLGGDADELMARFRRSVDPVVRRRAALYGSLGTAVVRTADGIRICGLWETEEGRLRMLDDFELRAALRDSAFADPRQEVFPVLSLRWRGELAEELAARAMEELWNDGDLDLADELYAEDYVGIDPVNGPVEGPEGVKRLIARYRDAFSGLRMQIQEQISAGDTAVTRWRGSGVHTGALLGIPATGREVTVEGVQFSRVRAGKIVAGHGVFDALALLRQLGAIPDETAAEARG